MGRPDPVPQFFERGVGLLGHLVGQQLEMVFEDELPPTRVGLWTTAASAAPPLPEFLDKHATDTKAYGNRTLCLCTGFQGLEDTITNVLRVWFHMLYATKSIPYKQLQDALVCKDAHGHARAMGRLPS